MLNDNIMKQRLLYAGKTDHDRLVKFKYNSFKSALYSYQKENILFNNTVYPCLINPDRLKENYDEKIISIDFDAGLKQGDIFEWSRTNTRWLVYLPMLDEEAYFRAEIRRCDYEIEVNNTKYWVYLRGPNETTTQWRKKHNINYNELNLSVLIYITRDENTDKFFRRGQTLKIKNTVTNEENSWIVEATDRYTSPGIIQVYLEEYFNNKFEDNNTNTPTKEEFIDPLKQIFGKKELYPYDNEKYSFGDKTQNGVFSVNTDKVKVQQINNFECNLTVDTGKSCNFILRYTLPDGGIYILPINVLPF